MAMILHFFTEIWTFGGYLRHIGWKSAMEK